MTIIKNAFGFFINFHKGLVNIVLHVLGFLGVFYSIYKLDWVLFGIFLVVVEIGHVYNHIAGIEPYDFRPRVMFWRFFIFMGVVGGFFLITQYLF